MKKKATKPDIKGMLALNDQLLRSALMAIDPKTYDLKALELLVQLWRSCKDRYEPMLEK